MATKALVSVYGDLQYAQLVENGPFVYSLGFLAVLIDDDSEQVLFPDSSPSFASRVALEHASTSDSIRSDVTALVRSAAQASTMQVTFVNDARGLL